MPTDSVGQVRARFDLLARDGGEERCALPVWGAVIDEALAGPAVAEVEVDASGDAGPERLLGRSARLALWREGQAAAPRRFCGVVRGIERAVGSGGALRLRVEPAFALLEEERLTRPFVGLSAMEILRAILAEHLGPLGGRQVELRRRDRPPDAAQGDVSQLCNEGFARRPLCVQYGETTHDFCRRLMAEEGLAHFFEHGETVERLVMVDGGPFDRMTEAVTVAPRRRMEAATESVFTLSRSLGPLGPSLAGAGDVLGFAAGRVVGLAASRLSTPAWLREADGGELHVLLTHVRHAVDLRGVQDPERATYECTFRGLPESAGFRPAAVQKPRAMEDWGIVESDHRNDPIDVDPLGSVRVAFLHDRRRGLAASRRSHPVPVSQAWAGDGYGTQILPRAGMVARIEYLAGDPDRPIVAACFPTGANRLPDRKTRLTIRTRELDAEPQGQDNQHDQDDQDDQDDRRRNELALDDSAQAEEVWIRAGRDHVRRVLHDEDARIDHHESRRIGGQQTLRVGGNRTKLVDGGEQTRIGGCRTVAVGSDQRCTGVTDQAEGGRDALCVGGRAESAVAGQRSTSVTGDETATFQAGRATEVTGDACLRVGNIRNVVVERQLIAQQGRSLVALEGGRARLQPERQLVLTNARGDLVIDAGGSAALTARPIELRCGASSIWIGRDAGAIRSPVVVARSAAGQLTLDEQGVVLAAGEITSTAVALNAIRGACVIFSDSTGNFAAQATETTIVPGDDTPDGGLT